jgi:hypothetical protein
MKQSNLPFEKSDLLSKPDPSWGFNWRYHLGRNSSGLLEDESPSQTGIPRFRTVYWVGERTINALRASFERRGINHGTYLVKSGKYQGNDSRVRDSGSGDIYLYVEMTEHYIRDVVVLENTWDNLEYYLSFFEGYSRAHLDK